MQLFVCDSRLAGICVAFLARSAGAAPRPRLARLHAGTRNARVLGSGLTVSIWPSEAGTPWWVRGGRSVGAQRCTFELTAAALTLRGDAAPLRRRWLGA